MNLIKLNIKTGNQKYPILIGRKLVNKISKILNDNSIKFEKCLFVIDKNVPNKLIVQIKKSLQHKKIFIYTFNANEKSKILTQLENLDSLEFTFNQLINNKVEKGSCLLEFPGKLKCNYFDVVYNLSLL